MFYFVNKNHLSWCRIKTIWMTSTMPKYAFKIYIYIYFERVNWNSATMLIDALSKMHHTFFATKIIIFSVVLFHYHQSCTYNFFYRFLWKMGATKSLKYGWRMMLNLNRNILRCISCIHTLLLNEGIPRAYRGKKLRLKNILSLPLIFEGMNSF